MDKKKTIQPWKFIDEDGTFELPDPGWSSHLYFPLVNEAGMMSAVTPRLRGDAKTGQHAFLLTPASVEDLHTSRSGRDFWVHVDGKGAWSATGSSASQIAQNFTGEEEDQAELRAGFLWHELRRASRRIGLAAKITSFVPASGDQVELMRVSLTNTSTESLHLTPTAAIPIYGRSADNLRDHRHVTSLLHRIQCSPHGVLVRPSLSFDERGHHPNTTTYAVLGVDGEGKPPAGYFPLVDGFIGEGGSLDWPEAAVRPLPSPATAGQAFEGYEAIGGLRFADVTLPPGGSCSYVLILAVLPDGQEASRLVETYGSGSKFDAWLEKTKAFWQGKVESLLFQTGNAQFDRWLRWVNLQPVLRRLFGNSFLPYHDYGRGGRGWRDLWQDILALLIMEPEAVDRSLWENFAGVRLDGSNATIIGSRPGEFKADRNNIPRVWMDHGAWPLLTVQLYLDQTGDLDFLLREQVYFKDQLVERAAGIDADWAPSQGTQQRTASGEIYQGSLLEHFLIQHLTAFFNVGEHNHIRLEGADWNDGMDMAAQRGESVAFTALYAGNLAGLGRLALELHKRGRQDVELAAELLPLLDSLQAKVDYDSVEAKQARLKEYFACVRHSLSGRKVRVPLPALAADLDAKAGWINAHIRSREWIPGPAKTGWFNGYYDNDGQPLEGVRGKEARMTLTGQVFTLMEGVATDEQAGKILRAVERYLHDAGLGGPRLNTNFHEVLLNMGRCFGFAYGHKENGAMFSHMAVMYAYALYARGYARPGYEVLEAIYRHSADFPVSRMYPGLPEYVDPRGRGMYPFLTGSASWYLFTLLTRAFGVRGALGDLTFHPMLVGEQFDASGKAAVTAWFAGRWLQITYENPDRLDFGEYRIASLLLDGKEIDLERGAGEGRIPRATIAALEPGQLHRVDVRLAAKKGK